MDTSGSAYTPFLESTEILLRGLCDDDTEANYPQWFNSRDVCLHNSHHRFPYTRVEAKSFVESLTNDKTRLVFAIVMKHDLLHVGNISLQNIDYICRSAELAVIIGERKYWGRGIAFDAGKLLINHGFQQLNLRRISLGTSAENISMIKTAEKLGFTREGEKRQAHYKNGRYVDINMYGLLKDEWVFADS